MPKFREGINGTHKEVEVSKIRMTVNPVGCGIICAKENKCIMYQFGNVNWGSARSSLGTRKGCSLARIKTGLGGVQVQWKQACIKGIYIQYTSYH